MDGWDFMDVVDDDDDGGAGGGDVAFAYYSMSEIIVCGSFKRKKKMYKGDLMPQKGFS